MEIISDFNDLNDSIIYGCLIKYEYKPAMMKIKIYSKVIYYFDSDTKTCLLYHNLNL